MFGARVSVIVVVVEISKPCAEHRLEEVEGGKAAAATAHVHVHAAEGAAATLAEERREEAAPRRRGKSGGVRGGASAEGCMAGQERGVGDALSPTRGAEPPTRAAGATEHG
eukprot:5408271-Prymnesium_polylepis.1